MSESIEKWKPVPEGSTITSPSIAVLGNKLHFLALGLTGGVTYHLWRNAVALDTIYNEVPTFDGWTEIIMAPATTTLAPAIASDGTKLYGAITGTDGIMYYADLLATSPTWTPFSPLYNGNPVPMFANLTDAPAIALHQGKLHFLTRSNITQYLDTIWTGSVNLGDGSTNYAPFTGHTKLPLSLTSNGTKLCAATTGYTGLFYQDIGVSPDWLSFSGTSKFNPAIALAGKALQVMVISSNSNAIFYNQVLLDTPNRVVGWRLMGGGGLSPSAPALASDGTKVYVAVRGNTNVIYYSEVDTTIPPPNILLYAAAGAGAVALGYWLYKKWA